MSTVTLSATVFEDRATSESAASWDVKPSDRLPVKTPVEAVEFVAEMIGKGFADVVILDLDDGKVYAPAEFARFYTNARR